MSVVTYQSELEVMNRALDFLREAPITSADENRHPAKWMKRNFKAVRNQVMTTHIWKFCMERATLTPDATAPAFEWTYRYLKPADCLRVLPLRVGGRLNGVLIPHIIEGDYILTNAPPPLYIRYVKLIDTVAKWPPLFVNAVAAKLAEELAPSLTGKQSAAEAMSVKFQQTLSLAASVDSAEGTHAEQYATDYDAARYYYIGSDY